MSKHALADLSNVPLNAFPPSGVVTASKSMTSAERLALTLEEAEGFAVVDSDTGKTWMLKVDGVPSNSADWLQLGDRDITIPEVNGLGTALDLQKNQIKSIRRRVCTTRNVIYPVTQGDVGANTATSWFGVYATDDVTDLQVGYPNPPNGVATIVKAAIEIGGTTAINTGIVYPLFFNSRRLATVDPGGILLSDPLGFKIAKGDYIKIRTYADGNGVALKSNCPNYSINGGGQTLNIDSCDSGAINTYTAYTFTSGFCVGKCNNPAILVLGDSIAAGKKGFELFGGWPRMAYGSYTEFGLNMGKNANILSLAIVGDTLGARKNADRFYKTQVYQFTDIAICELGINDIKSTSTSATILSDMQALWDELSQRGIKVWQTTITPHTNSTDSWNTVENQTPTTLTAAQLTELNTAIRALPAPLTGIIEIADVAMSARNSNKWKAPNYTTDGLHPNGESIQLLFSAAIPADFLTR